VEALRGRRGGERISALKRELRHAMEDGCGVYREQSSMLACVEQVGQIRQRAQDLQLEDTSTVFNTELIAGLELQNMVEVAEAVAASAAHRKESRGAHTCKDFPTRDDQNYLYHTLCYREDSGTRLAKKDVTLGVWVPEERKY
jgi:succinate dehydrogenase / fumarate reductase flavoprotein subunit